MATQSIFDSIKRGDTSSVQTLLDEDPMLVHARDYEFSKQHPDLQPNTTLQAAASLGHLDMCRLLVERGAEVYTNPMNSYPPVMLAAWERHTNIVDYFLKEIPDKASGTNGLGVAINLAARAGWTEIVRKHIEADPLSVFQRGWIGDTPLHWPAHNNHVEILAVLLDAGGDIEAEEIGLYGGSPLHWASEHAPEAVALLLSRGAKVDSRNSKPGTEFTGMTPLIMNATQKDDCAEITRLLLDAGADINATDAKGRTALSYAQEKNLTRIIGVLASQ